MLLVLGVVCGQEAPEASECAGWAAVGECVKNPEFMLGRCGEACAGEKLSFYDLEAFMASGDLTLDFESLVGRVVLVTNVASE